MSLTNPVSAIKETFIHLNEKRISNLTNKRSKQVSNTGFCVGQFVLLTDEVNVRAEARAKLSIPNRSRLYKIVALNKNAFTATILDVLSGSRREVLTSRLCNLDLHTLEMYNFSSPTFYKNLQKLTDMVRRKYVPPRWLTPPGLHLLNPNDEVLREDHGIDDTDSVGDNVTDDDNKITEVTDDNRDIYTTDDGSVPVTGDDTNITEVTNDNEDMYTTDGGSVEKHKASVPTSRGEEGEEDEEEEDGRNGEMRNGLDGTEVRDVPEKMKTRYGGTRHVKVYGTHPTPGAHESILEAKTHKSILKPTNYKIFQNFISDQLKALSKHSFYARKQAFNIHSQVCNALDCSTCSCAKKVHHLKFDPGNFSKYMYSEYPQITLKNKSMNKKVIFADNTTPEKRDFKKFHLSKKLVEKACEHCVSFTEINLLSAI